MIKTTRLVPRHANRVHGTAKTFAPSGIVGERCRQSRANPCADEQRGARLRWR